MELISNPFERQALKSSELLAGSHHNEIYKELTQKIENSTRKNHMKSFLVKGERGTGKTSLMKLCSNFSANHNCIPIEIMLTEDSISNIFSFWYALYSNLWRELKKHEILTKEIDEAEYAIVKNELPENRELWVFEFVTRFISYQIQPHNIQITPEDLISDLKFIIQEIHRQIRFSEFTKLIFFIDEAQLLYKNRKVLEFLRHIMQEEIGAVFFLVAQKDVDDSLASEVFERMERVFNIKELECFKDESDIDQFFKKSLPNWNDKNFKLNINNYEKLKWDLLKLTGGKPAFLIQIATELFDSFLDKKDSKIRLNENILQRIASDLESNQASEGAFEGFNTNRTEQILNLDSSQLFWFRILMRSNVKHSPRTIYRIFKVLAMQYDLKHDEEYFKNLFFRLVKHNIVSPITQNEKTQEGIGFKVLEKEPQDILDQIYQYKGNASEEHFLSVRFNLKGENVLFTSDDYVKVFTEELLAKTGYNFSTRFIIIRQNEFHDYLDGKFVSSNEKTQNFLSILKKENYKNLDIENADVGYIKLLLRAIKPDFRSNIELHVSHLKLNQKFISIYSYKYDKITANNNRDLHLNFYNDLMNISKDNDINFEFYLKYETIEKSDFITINEFHDYILSSENPVIKKCAFDRLVEDAIEKFLEICENQYQEPEKDHNQEINNLIVKLIKIHDLIDFESDESNTINTIGFMLMNFGPLEICAELFEHLLKRLPEDFTDYNASQDEIHLAFLIIYNFGMINLHKKNYESALNQFNRASNIYENFLGEARIGALNKIVIKNEKLVAKIMLQKHEKIRPEALVAECISILTSKLDNNSD